MVPAAQMEQLVEPLSERELEILNWIARGASNKEIADQLFIAEGTVKNHVTHILGKLGVRDRTQAALKARELGLL
jgi:ATP/maltotriose-dependent transcriptional regulator MalT